MVSDVKIALSNSALDRLSQCPLSYYHAYINPERPAKEGVTDYYANYGTLIHFFAEMYPRTNYHWDLEWVDNKEDEEDTIDNILKSYGNIIVNERISLDVKQMLAIYDELFPMINFPKEETREEYYEQGKKFIEQLPSMDWSKVIGLEKYFKVELDGVSDPVTGVIDKVERDENGIIVTDYKTSKPYSENAILQKNQLPLYGIACYFLYGEFPYKYRYHFVRFDKIVEVEISEERLKQVVNIIRFKNMQVLSYLKQGKFPAQYMEFYCKNFCGYSRLCPAFQTYNPVPNNKR